MKYKLVWEDNFNYPTEELKEHFLFEHGGRWANQEIQYYTNGDNVKIENNMLVIESRKEDVENKHYTSARITTRGIKEFQYGRIAVCAKIPRAKGSWPAIWMMPVEGRKYGWPRCGEIDIMEHTPQELDYIHSSLHSGTYNHVKNTQRTYKKYFDNVDRFIEYAMDWTKDYIEFFVNGESLVRYNKGGEGIDTSFEGWPFDQKFYLILNTAVGGTWGGEVDDESLPWTHEFKYIRYYEIDE